MSTPSTQQAPEYVLGTGPDELDRLALQHRLWADAAGQAWRHAGIGVGQQVLDIGCGPGFASFDLAQHVTRSGRVIGIDESAGFIAHLNGQAASRGLPQLSGHVGDVRDLQGTLAAVAAPGSFDLAYARWVLCFVQDTAAVLGEVAALLKPGGRFVVHDYFNYRSMTLAPRRESFDKVVAATIRSWEARGGDTDICGRLPALLGSAGFKVEHMTAHLRIARGHETMFDWVQRWWQIFAPKLVSMGLFAQADCEQLFADLDEVRHSDSQFVFCPPVFEIIAVKR